MSRCNVGLVWFVECYPLQTHVVWNQSDLCRGTLWKKKPRCEEKFSPANALCMPSSTPVFYVPSEWVVQFLGHFSTVQLWYVSSPFWEILFGLVTSPSNFEIISCMLESVDLFWSILDSTLNSALYRVMRLPFDLLALDHIGRVIFTRDEYVQSSL